MRIPVLDLQPAIAELRPELDAAYRRVLDSGRLLLGDELSAFEREYAASVGVPHCVGVANGLEALQMVLMAWNVGPGDEVIVPAHGYIATYLAVTHAGATPVPCEPDPLTWNIDPQRIEALVTPRTRAILPIHLYGQTADLPAINAIAKRHGLRVLEDAAQSHGARCHGQAAGSLGDAAGVSFYPSKNLGALADGGAVTTHDAALADRIRHLRNYGSKVRYQHEVIGLNSRLSELQAAFLRVKLAHLETWNQRRRTLAQRYLTQLRGVGDLQLPLVPAWAEPVWHLFVIRTQRRDALQAHLESAGIGTQIHYPVPPHLTPAYQSAGWRAGQFPLAEQLAREVLSLPIGPHHTADQIDAVCDAVRSFFWPLMPDSENTHRLLATADLIPAAWADLLEGGLVRAFNPGLTADGSGGWLLAYRLVGQDAKRRIGICRLDAKGAVITGSAQPLSDSFRLRPGCLYPAEAYTWFADPRLFRLGGRLFVYWNSGWHEPRNHQFVQEIDPTALTAIGHAHELLLEGPRQKLEKNWTVFEHADRALAVYSVQPQRVLTFEANEPGDWLMRELASTAWSAPSYPPCHGGLRGGTPPVLHAGQFWSFCHTVHDGPDGYCYNAAAYTFAAAAPFAPIAAPKYSLQLAPLPVPPRAYPKLNPAVGEVVYPCGAARSGAGWLISYGLNDERCGISWVSDATVADSLHAIG